MQDVAPLPRIFCWTRFGTEAGEPIEAILRRKESERRSTGGVFFWGIGNSVAPGMRELVRRTSEPEVLFSPIKGRPREVDVSPPALGRWRAGLGLHRERVALPVTARVMSGQARAVHYALVCASDEPLLPHDLGRLNFNALRNLVSGNRVGASQVTAVVDRTHEAPSGTEYVVALRARLVSPYFIRLTERFDEGNFNLAA